MIEEIWFGLGIRRPQKFIVNYISCDCGIVLMLQTVHFLEVITDT